MLCFLLIEGNTLHQQKYNYEFLYFNIHFIAVAWNLTCNISEVCLYFISILLAPNIITDTHNTLKSTFPSHKITKQTVLTLGEFSFFLNLLTLSELTSKKTANGLKKIEYLFILVLVLISSSHEAI